MYLFLFLTHSWKENGNIFICKLKRKHFSLARETWRLWSPFTHLAQTMNSFPLSTFTTCVIYAWEIFGLMIRKFVRKMSMTLVISCASINCSVCFMSVTSYETDFPQHPPLSKSFILKENKSFHVLSRVGLNIFCYIARKTQLISVKLITLMIYL